MTDEKRRTNNNFLFNAKDPEVTRKLFERAKLHAKHPSTKEELIALARGTSTPITVCPPGLAPGSYDTEAERTNRVSAGISSYRTNKIRGEY